MKVITQKQMKLAIEHIAGLLKKDGANETLTVQEWLDVAQVRPAQFPSSLPALEILELLGFGDELVRAEPWASRWVFGWCIRAWRAFEWADSEPKSSRAPKYPVEIPAFSVFLGVSVVEPGRQRASRGKLERKVFRQVGGWPMGSVFGKNKRLNCLLILGVALMVSIGVNEQTPRSDFRCAPFAPPRFHSPLRCTWSRPILQTP